MGTSAEPCGTPLLMFLQYVHERLIFLPEQIGIYLMYMNLI